VRGGGGVGLGGRRRVGGEILEGEEAGEGEDKKSDEGSEGAGFHGKIKGYKRCIDEDGLIIYSLDSN
jgi:hypothetical protein